VPKCAVFASTRAVGCSAAAFGPATAVASQSIHEVPSLHDGVAVLGNPSACSLVMLWCVLRCEHSRQTPIPPEVLSEFMDNLAREFGGDVDGELNALTTLQKILDDCELEADVSANASLDALTMRFVLVSFARLDEDDPVQSRIASVLPDGIHGRCHYCELLRIVYCRAVQLRASVLQAGNVVVRSGQNSPPQIPSAAAGASPVRKRQLTRSQVLLWGRAEVERWCCLCRFCCWSRSTRCRSCRFLSQDLGCSDDVVEKIATDSGSMLLKYCEEDLQDPALELTPDEIATVWDAILALLKSPE
jgi:hypothetical protein